MTRPVILDLFCGGGGAAMGYSRAGFTVIGADIADQPNYPFEWYQIDLTEIGAFESLMNWIRPDALHASPPCQRWLGVPFAKGENAYPDLIGPVRNELQRTGLPWVLENLPGAPLDGPIFCGVSFGLPIVRHRRFETSFPLGLVPSACPQGSFERATDHPGTYPFAHGAWRPAWRKHVIPEVWPWMTLRETHDAIPPDYTEWIGRQLLEHLKVAA